MSPLAFGVCRVLVFLQGPVVVCGPALWSCSLVCKLLSALVGPGAFISPVCVWVDIWVITWPAPLCGPRVLACCCLCWGLWTRFCCTWGPRCPTGILSPPHSALFGASSDSTWWWTLLSFVAGDAFCTWQTLGYPQELIFSASPCLVAELVAWDLCICAWVPGFPVAEGLDLCPC